MNRELKIGGLYHHFKKEKDQNYRVIGVALHTETEEKLVIYQQEWGDRTGLFARPLDMFLSEVDKEKYPNVTQKYRLEEIKEDDLILEGESNG